MGEWPKVIERFEDPEGPPKLYEVVPDDLARELYEALKRAEPYLDDDYGQLPALARYEREVGSE